MLLSVYANAWEVNTHRAIDREASDIATNLENFMDDARLDRDKSYKDKYDKYMGYETTYFNYITYNKEDDEPTAQLNQTHSI